jgi:glycosyltransferase involved in cell wall biosynthesis
LKKIIITRNDEKCIKNCIESLHKLEGEIIVGDLESSDKTIDILKKYNVTIVNLKWEKSYSKAWNQLLSNINDWVFVINPGEVLSWAEEVELEDESSYSVDVISNGWIHQSSRIWHTKNKYKMINPIFEHCEKDFTNLFPAILSANTGRKSSEVISIINDWKSNFPTNHETSYYQAMAFLGAGNLNSFISSANEFLFRAKEIDNLVILIWLYLASIYFIKKDYNQTEKLAAQIIAEKPWIAEAWCLAGNAAREKGQIGRASMLYRLAILCGSQRPRSEKLPMNIKSYKEEPEKFLTEFDSIVARI